MIVSLNSKSKHNVVMIINIVFFTLVQMLFALFIFIVESNKIDLSSNNNLYSNEQTLTLLELGMGLFFIWIFILFIVLYLKKADKIFKVKNSDNANDFDEYINDYNEPAVTITNDSVASVTNSVYSNDIANSIFSQDYSSGFVDTSSTDNSNLVSNVNYDDFKNGFSQDYVSTIDDNNVQGIVPGFLNSANEEVVDFDIFLDNFNKDSFSYVNSSYTSNSDLERKNDDVEIIDFDI